MDDYSPHSDLGAMSNSGISDTGNVRAGKNGLTAADVTNLKRQGYVDRHPSNGMDSASFLALIQAMSEQRFMNQVQAANRQNHRDGQVTSDGVSQTGVSLFHAGTTLNNLLNRRFELPSADNDIHLNHDAA